jgi:Mn-dependent DtxR family transcriptional regulator
LTTLALAQKEDQTLQLDTLTNELGVARSEVRSTLSQLHSEGLLDVLRMRLTLRGLALGSALSRQRLAPLHAEARVQAA